jgi:hypothetical protein
MTYVEPLWPLARNCLAEKLQTPLSAFENVLTASVYPDPMLIAFVPE